MRTIEEGSGALPLLIWISLTKPMATATEQSAARLKSRPKQGVQQISILIKFQKKNLSQVLTFERMDEESHGNVSLICAAFN